MIIRYKSVTGEVSEVEVSDGELYETHIELNRRERNNNQRETRRHVLMSVAEYEQGMQFADETVDVERAVLVTDQSERLHRAMENLSPRQRALVHSVYIERRSIVSIAREQGVSERTIHYRLSSIHKKLCKDLS